MKHFNNKGQPKRAWDDVMEARRALLAEGQAMELYLCSTCHRYHGATIASAEARRAMLAKWRRQLALVGGAS